jgi:hypothetical protein
MKSDGSNTGLGVVEIREPNLGPLGNDSWLAYVLEARYGSVDTPIYFLWAI